MRCAWPKPVRTCRFPTLHAEPAEVFSLRRCALGSAVLVLIAALRIVSTYTVLTHTIDEPIHLGAGMEWLDHGTITGDASHPPLARALSAIGPYLAGERRDSGRECPAGRNGNTGARCPLRPHTGAGAAGHSAVISVGLRHGVSVG